MHELSIIQSALEIVEEQARQQGAVRVLAIRMAIGDLSGVVPEALEFAFEALASETLAEGARLEIDRVPVTCYCERCRKEFEADVYARTCPACGTPSAEVRRGREMHLVSIEVE